jgi:hypothetical protein
MKSQAQAQRRVAAGLACFAAAAAFGIANCVVPVDDSEDVEVGSTSQQLARSSMPPAGLTPSQVPQFVAITFDDNFGPDGMTWATGASQSVPGFFTSKVNPAGSGNPATFDGTPVRLSFYHNSVYMAGEVQARWQWAFDKGNELCDHTVNHSDGLNYPVTGTPSWTTEISNCRTALAGLSGASTSIIKGFRSPYLHYNDNLFTTLQNLGFTYDTSIMGCWANSETGANCPWPYTLDQGSADADAIVSKWPDRNVRGVTSQHPGLWEVPVSVVFVPPDELATQYGFTSGLRTRVGNLLGGAQNPNFFDSSTGKIVGMDITLFSDAKMSRAEVLATLKYTLDQRLAGNRAPLVFVAHTHVYQSWQEGAMGLASLQDRRGTIEDFVNYALSKPEVRMRSVSDIVDWMNNPAPLTDLTENGTVTTAGNGNVCNTSTETAVKAYDNSYGTKWCFVNSPSTSSPLSTVYDFANADSYAVTSYKVTTANDVPTRDPKDWTFQGCLTSSCTAGSEAGWVTLDTRTNQFAGAARGQTNTYTFANSTAYQQYRLRITANNGATITQMAEIQMYGSAGSCTPTSCSAQGKNCGTIVDNCGGTLNCGSCSAPLMCGGGGTANVCGCAPTSCVAQGKNCGSISDGCGGTLNCGSCSGSQTCGGGGVLNVCGTTCTPTTCSAQGKNCGTISDGCGGTLTCGTCSGSQTCGGGGISNVCGASSGSCSPTLSSYTQGKCDGTIVYNGNLYKCVSQAASVGGSDCGDPSIRCSQFPPDFPNWGSMAWQLVQSCQ